jgi:SAM-dependent methyltransferase
MSLPPPYFDRLYAETADPWSLADRWYEHRKYAVTIACLPRARFRRGFEPGCSVGVLTAMLARRCDELVATDVSAAAVATARERVRDEAGVTVTQMQVPRQWPAGEFDLIVLSEIGYYLSMAELRELVDRAVGSLAADGVLVAVHWRHPVTDYPRTGDAVHDVLAADPRLVGLAEHLEADFRLDVLTRPGVGSVAQAEGLVGEG